MNDLKQLHPVWLGLGSNLGHRIRNLNEALQRLSSVVELERLSPTYETKAWGYEQQPDFLNLCVEIATANTPVELLAEVKRIETEVGRVDTFRWGPRVIDIDILLFDDYVVDKVGLRIPHPEMTGRAFVLAPLADIAPDLVHPVTGRTVQQMLGQLDLAGVRLLAAEEQQAIVDGLEIGGRSRTDEGC